MFFFLSKTLSLLIQPLTWIIIPLVLSFVPRFSAWRKRLRISSLAIFIFFTNPFTTNWAIKAWEYPPHEGVVESVPYAIVLGGMANPMIQVDNQIQFNDNVERILSAIELYRAGKVGKIVISGGSGDLRYELSETPLLREMAISLDVPAEDIIIETQSKNTHQNASYVKAIGIDFPPNTLLITSASHMRRALGCFKKVGLTVVPYPVDYGAETLGWHFMNFIPDTNMLFSWGELIREWIGYVTYDIVGYI